MSAPSAFEIGRNVGNNLGNAFAKVKDENAIERILSDAMGTGDPAVLQSSIGKILSQVSPERQGVALQYLQNAYSNVQKKQEQTKTEEKEKTAAKEAGYTYGAHPQVAAQQVKDKAKGSRLSQYGLGAEAGQPGQPQAGGQMGQPGQEQPALAGNPAIPAAGQPPQGAPTNQVPGSIFKKLSDDQLVVASGAPDREVSEPAKAELKRRDEERNLTQKKEEGKIKRHTDLSQKVLERADQIAEALPQKKSALSLMKDAIANRDLSFWSRDNLAELTGIEGLRSQEGAIFKTAAKEYFLGNIARAGARPNQWIEQQIADMMTKIGRSPEANLSVARALENELGLDEERVRLTERISNELENTLGYIPRDLATRVNKELAQYAERKQVELFNDLRAIKSIAEKKPQDLKKVEEGTPVSKVVAQALLRQFNNDPQKASDEAKKLGYTF